MPCRPSNRIALALCCLLIPTAAPAVDQVIFKDGFTIVGKRFREQDAIVDRNNGTNVVLPRARGFDIIETGPKWIIYSNRTQQVASVLENVPGEDQLREFKRDFMMKGRSPLPNGRVDRVPDFNEKWLRVIRMDIPETRGFAEIEQRIFSISPTRIVMPSANYMWYPFFDTREYDPMQVRKYLGWHPDLQEQPGVPEIAKRVDIAEFMKDAGWLDQALSEIADARAAVPGDWPADQTERVEKIEAEVRKRKAIELVKDLEIAARAGNYRRARALLEQVNAANADGTLAKNIATIRAQLETLTPRYEKAARLLRSTLDRQAAANVNLAHASLGGGIATAIAAGRPLSAAQAGLINAGEQVLAELHPDTAERVDFFISLADQAERRIAAGDDPGATPEQLLALAITGWLKGKNGAEQNVETALRYWAWRDMLMAYQTEPVLNRRRQLYHERADASGALPPDEIAQIINYLPPAIPENLARRTGTLVSAGDPPNTSVYRLNTGPLPETANGVNYLVRLPSEYHHGRPSRLLVALTNNNIPAVQLVNQLAAEAERRGYIIIAPEWVSESDGAYDYRGNQHFKARAAIRDALRHFRIDNDRVFLFGFLEGANYAMDLGVSHPDLFAGVAAMGANPKDMNMFRLYWPNAQKLPFYITIGSIAADSFQNLRLLFENWMPKGYPALGVAYRGRGYEWFPTEIPTIFEWMEPKKRLTGTAVLRIKEPVEAWVSMRDSDDRFYWVGSSKIHRENKLETWGGKSFHPAEINADIREGNRIIIRTRGTENVIIWLDRNMINWSSPVIVNLNGSAPQGYKPRVLQPDIEFMLEQLYAHGDRSLLFLNRLEFPTTR